MNTPSDTLHSRLGSTASLHDALSRSPLRSASIPASAESFVEVAIPLRTMRRDLRYVSQTALTTIPLWMSDLAVLSTSLLLAAWLSSWLGLAPSVPLPELLLSLSLAMTLAHIAVGLYPGIGLCAVTELRWTTIASTLVFGVFHLATAIPHGDDLGSRLVIACSYAGCLVGLPILRRLTRLVAGNWTWWKQPVLVLGSREEGAQAYRTLLDNPHLGLRPVGVLDDVPTRLESSHKPAWHLGHLREAPLIAEDRGVFWAVIAMSQRSAADVAEVIDRLSVTIPHLLVLPMFAQAGRRWDGAHDCGGSLGARLTEMLLLPIPRLIKRSMDLGLGIVISILLLPLMVAIAVAIKLASPGPVFFKQLVPGVAGQIFCMWKFRTMFVDGNQILSEWLDRNPSLREEWQRHHKLRDDPRVTAVGRFLRRFSLDELPQLWNVLKGEMSLVGPRPYPLYECEEMQTKAPLVLRIRPGITGLWQVSGRSDTTFEQRLMTDTKYVRNWTIWMDLAILAKTLIVVMRKTGAY